LQSTGKEKRSTDVLLFSGELIQINILKRGVWVPKNFTYTLDTFMSYLSNNF